MGGAFFTSNESDGVAKKEEFELGETVRGVGD